MTPISRGAVLFLSYYYPPMSAVGGLRIARFAKYLPEYGYDTVVVAARSEPGLPASGPEAAYVPEEGARAALLERAEILATRAAQRFLGFHSHRLEWIAPAAGAAARVAARRPLRAVISSYPTLSSHLAALRLQSRFHIPWIADFRDPPGREPPPRLPHQPAAARFPWRRGTADLRAGQRRHLGYVPRPGGVEAALSPVAA